MSFASTSTNWRAIDKAADKAKTKQSQSWKTTFDNIVKQQVNQLQNEPDVHQLLLDNKYQVLYRTWSDVGRSFGSSIGSNISDLQFISVNPQLSKLADAANGDIVSFPAVRKPNYSDEVDLIEPSKIVLAKVRDRDGDIHTGLTVADLLKNLGLYVSDLPHDADFSDPVDKETTQVSSQFSVLPVSKDQPAEIGLAAFGYQLKNLHIVVCPDGSVGWALENYGSSHVFIRHSKDYAAIKIASEERKEVSDKFFQPEKPRETLEEEQERYKQVENRLVHIQVELNRPDLQRDRGERGSTLQQECCIKKGSSFGGIKHKFYPLKGASQPAESDNDEDDEDCADMEEESSASDNCYLFEAEEKTRAIPQSAKVTFGLARVSEGRVLGPVAEKDKVTKEMSRAKGVRVRVTHMYYAVDGVGSITSPLLERFFKQMTFERRVNAAQHGSLVTGQGTWGGPEHAPIKLAPLPSGLGQLVTLFEQIPTGSIQKFALGGAQSGANEAWQGFDPTNLLLGQSHVFQDPRNPTVHYLVIRTADGWSVRSWDDKQ